MENVLQTFKSLYADSDVLKKHLILFALFIIPSIAGGTASLIDKDLLPLENIYLLLISLVFLILSFIPSTFLAGYYLDFCKSRLNDQTGLPTLNWDSFIKGLKVIPLSIAWGFYYFVVGTACFLVPLIPFYFIYKAGIKEHLVLLFAYIFFVMILYFILYFILLFVFAFVSYVYIRFSNDLKYNAQLFNPCMVVKYMALSFKKTVVVVFKYLIASLVCNFAASMVIMAISLLSLAVGLIAVVLSNSPENAVNWPLLISMIIISSFGVLVTSYVNLMVLYSLSDNLVKVYKSEIQEV